MSNCSLCDGKGTIRRNLPMGMTDEVDCWRCAELRAVTAQRDELQAELLALADSYDRLLLAYGKPFEWGLLSTEAARKLAKTAPPNHNAAPVVNPNEERDKLALVLIELLSAHDDIRDSSDYLPGVRRRRLDAARARARSIYEAMQSPLHNPSADVAQVSQKGRWTP